MGNTGHTRCDPEDFNGRLIIHKSDRIYIPLKSISDKVANHLKRIAAFKNPEFYSKRAMRISTYNIPRIICRADFTDEYLAMPRGARMPLSTCCVPSKLIMK